MIQSKETFTIETNGGMTSTEFKLREEDKAHIFNVLRNNLYSDKMLAVIREYSTNAWDANMANKKGNIPIQVTLPNNVDQTFKVRDFGTGLSEDDIFNVYASYGLSTKRGTNKLVGTLGFGSKSGSAYVDNFTITSWHGGKKSVYEAYIDPTNIGRIVKLHEEPSDEPTGLCITIAVDSKDSWEFIQTATKFYTHFSPMPEFFGVDISVNISKIYDAYTLVHESKNGRFLTAKNYTGNPGVYVVMGNISYPFPSDKIDWFPRSDYYLLVLNMNIGDIKFTTSRESIELDEQTVNAIVKKADEFKKEIISGIQSKIDSQESASAAIEFYWSLDKFSNKHIDQNGFTYKGNPLDVRFIEKWGFKKYNDIKDVVSKFEHSTLALYKKSSPIIIINDGNFPASELRARIVKASNENSNSLFLNSSIADSKSFLALPECQGMKCVYLSEVMDIPLKRKSSKSEFSKNENIFLWTGGTFSPYSKCWSSAPDCNPTAEKIYVEINAFIPRINVHKPMQRMKQLMQMLNVDKIYGVKSKYVKNLDSTWIDLDTYINRQVEKMMNAKVKKLYISADIDGNFSYDTVTSRMKTMYPKSKSKCDTINTLLDRLEKHKQIINSSTEVNRANITTLNNIHRSYTLEASVRTQLESLRVETQKEMDIINGYISSIEKTYPLIKLVSQWSYGSPIVNDHMALYIDAVAEANKTKAQTTQACSA